MASTTAILLNATRGAIIATALTRTALLLLDGIWRGTGEAPHVLARAFPACQGWGSACRGGERGASDKETAPGRSRPLQPARATIVSTAERAPAWPLVRSPWDEGARGVDLGVPRKEAAPLEVTAEQATAQCIDHQRPFRNVLIARGANAFGQTACATVVGLVLRHRARLLHLFGRRRAP